MMPICLSVSLLSGKRIGIEAPLDSSVDTIRQRAQQLLGIGRSRLMTSSGCVLDGHLTVEEAELRHMDDLMLCAQPVRVARSNLAFCAILGDGSVVPWGIDSVAVESVNEIQSNALAFAAILTDGSVATWGSPGSGGDSSAVKEQLKSVKHIQATRCAFAALLSDRSVVTWGSPVDGGDSSAVQKQLKNVRDIQANLAAYAAILGDGSAVTWGRALSGGDSTTVQHQLKNVRQIQASDHAFAAVLADGSVVTWGAVKSGGDSRLVQEQLKNVQKIQASSGAFAAISSQGSVVTWGSPRCGGDSSTVQEKLKKVQAIQSNDSAFAAILADGFVVTWGDARHGGDSSPVQEMLRLRMVHRIQASKFAFAAVLDDGSLVSWGDSGAGGDSSAVQEALRNVQAIQANDSAFAAILGDGSVVTWGMALAAGDSRLRWLYCWGAVCWKSRVVTFWAAVQAVDAHMGPTEIWPGSHLVARGFIGSLPPALQRQRKVPEYMYVDGQYQAVSPAGEPITEEQLQEEREASANAALELKRRVAAGTLEAMTGACGDVVAMDCRVFHRGSANCSSAVRVLFNASFQEDLVCGRRISEGCKWEFPKITGLPWQLSAAAPSDPRAIHGFTYHCLPDVLEANYRLRDFRDSAKVGNRPSAPLCFWGFHVNLCLSRGERELKAEIRAAQRLLLEVAEGARHLSPERLTAPLANAKGAPLAAPLPALPGFGTPPASGGVELDVGSLAPRGTAAIAWSVPGVRARTRASPTRLLFPLGSRRRTKPGHCSLYLTGPQGAHLQFLLRLGSVEHGPLECIFDRPEKDSGRHDFCTLEDELEARMKLPTLVLIP
eukprot:s2104_g2.t1